LIYSFESNENFFKEFESETQKDIIHSLEVSKSFKNNAVLIFSIEKKGLFIKRFKFNKEEEEKDEEKEDLIQVDAGKIKISEIKVLEQVENVLEVLVVNGKSEVWQLKITFTEQ
jgi:hypothetical protein